MNILLKFNKTSQEKKPELFISKRLRYIKVMKSTRHRYGIYTLDFKAGRGTGSSRKCTGQVSFSIRDNHISTPLIIYLLKLFRLFPTDNPPKFYYLESFNLLPII